eukprot:6182106-Pleurochrysis_carterae.AAC.4
MHMIDAARLCCAVGASASVGGDRCAQEERGELARGRFRARQTEDALRWAPHWRTEGRAADAPTE